jgi:hypothetical protein
MRAPALVFVCGCALALCAACGSSKRGSQSGSGSVIGTGSKQDGGARGGGGSAAAAKDAGGPQHKIYSGDRYLCGYDDQDMLMFAGNTQLPEVAAASDERGFALVHHDEAGNVLIEAVPVDAAPQDPVTLLDASSDAQGLALGASGTHFMLAWRSAGGKAAGDATLQARELGSAASPAQQLTSALVASTNGGELSALLALDDGFIAGYVERASAGNELRLQRLGADGALMGSAVTVPGVGARAPEDVHLARLDNGGALVAWLERDAQAQGHVMALVLGSTLAPAGAGSALMLSKNAVHDGRFDLAARSLSEGLIYHALDGDVRDAIKYRRVDQAGLAEQAVLNLVNAPGAARDGSIAAFGQGYAVAYRQLPSLGVDHPSVHVAFINQFGAVVYQAELDASSETGGRTTVATTSDGHLLVGWTTDLPGSTAAHALKLYCPGALQLCGGHQ